MIKILKNMYPCYGANERTMKTQYGVEIKYGDYCMKYYFKDIKEIQQLDKELKEILKKGE